MHLFWREVAKKIGRPCKGPPKSCIACAMFWEERLRRVIHIEFDRMWRVFEADHFRHLQLDVAVDEVIIEHATGLEEVAVLVALAERLAQRAAHGRYLLQLGGRQGGQILVHLAAR